MFNCVAEAYAGKEFDIKGDQILGNVNGYVISATYKRYLNLDIYYYATPEQKEFIKEEILKLKRIGFKPHFTPTGLNYSYIPWKTATTASSSFGALGALCTMRSSTEKAVDAEIELLHEIIKILKSANAKGHGYCPHCGEELTVEDSVCLPNNGHEVYVHRHCVDSINAILFHLQLARLQLLAC